MLAARAVDWITACSPERSPRGANLGGIADALEKTERCSIELRAGRAVCRYVKPGVTARHLSAAQAHSE